MSKKNELLGQSLIKGNEIDFIVLVKVIWEGRKTIYYSLSIAITIGLMIAFLSPAKYTVTATIIPSVEKSRSSVGGLSALAGMAGINLGSMMGNSSGIPTRIYPEVVNSYPFLNDLIHEKYNFKKFDEPISIYDYVLSDTIENFGDKLLKYTIKLPWTLKDIMFSKVEGQATEAKYNVIILSDDEVLALKAVEGVINVSVDEETGLVSLSATTNEPVLTAQYVQKSLILLKKYIVDFKTKQANENLRFVQESYNEKKSEYERLQQAFFEYKDRYRNIISERGNPEFQRLSDEYDLVSTIYEELARQLEQAKIAVKENTPAFSVVEPAKVPLIKSAPRKSIILIVSLIFGVLIGVGIIIGRLLWHDLTRKIESINKIN